MDRLSKPIERILKRDRIAVFIALLIVMLLAWTYTLLGVGMGMNAFEMTNMPAIVLNDSAAKTINYSPWDFRYFILMLTMWWLMMIAMMLPSATPIILLAAALNRRSQAANSPYGRTSFFTFGYLIAWLLFSFIAVSCQWLLEYNGVMTHMMQNSSKALAAGLLIAAGVWQCTPIKQACLRHCRSPVEFLTRHRRPGNTGALVMGLHHGTYCLGCCWFLMGLLFVVCIMDVYWIIGLTLYVIIEKLFARGPLFGQLTGMGFLGIGIWLLF